MLSRFTYLLSAACAVMCLTSCNDGGKKNAGGPIVLGDPATIVTETDSAYLQDMVMDYQPTPVQQPATDTVQTAPSPDTTAKQAAVETLTPKEEPAKPEPVVEKGLNMDLDNVTLVIPNVSGKGRGTSFQLKDGSLNGKQIKITEGTVQKISQRYQTVVVAENSMGTLVLDNLSTTTGWQTLKGAGKSFTISGLDERNLATPRATPAGIKTAVTKAVRKKRISKAKEQKWVASLKNARSANQKPLDVELRSVMWRIEGKDAKGKPFTKQVRVDMPL